MSEPPNNCIMKKHLTGAAATIACFLISGILAGCSKEAGIKPCVINSQDNQAAQTPEHSTRETSPILHFFRGSFISQVNTTSVTDSGSVLIFDFTVKKNFEKGANNQLSIAYGDPQFADRGWKYEITVDTTTYEILLSPNDKMKADIVPRSFQTVAATFDRSTRNFNFITRFKELNGNKSEVAETIFKK